MNTTRGIVRLRTCRITTWTLLERTDAFSRTTNRSKRTTGGRAVRCRERRRLVIELLFQRLHVFGVTRIGRKRETFSCEEKRRGDE